MNVCVFYGRLASEIDYKTYKDGEVRVAEFRFVVNERRGQKGTFLRGKAFNANADVMNEWFKKGDRVSFRAHAVQPPKYENTKGNNIYPNVEFFVDSIEFVETKADKVTKTDWKAEQKKDDFMDIPQGISQELAFE